MKRSLSLDIFKLILSIFILVAHIPPLFESITLGSWLITNGVSRLMVPCFFIINGYFIASKIDDMSVIKKYIIQLLKVYAVWSLFYLYFYHEGTNIITILGRLIMGYHHLWYLPALMSGIIILIISRKFLKKDSHILIFILIIYLIGNLLSPIRNSGVLAHYFRNGFILGFPFIAFGYFIRKYNIKETFESWQLIAVVIASIITVLLESYTYYIEGMKVTDMYLSALLFSPACVLLCLRHPLMVKKSILVEYFSDIPGGVYYLHLFFIFKMYSFTNNIYTVPWIFILSILTTIPIIFINRRVRIFL